MPPAEFQCATVLQHLTATYQPELERHGEISYTEDLEAQFDIVIAARLAGKRTDAVYGDDSDFGGLR